MSSICSTNYSCVPVWYDATNSVEGGGEDIVLMSDGPHAEDVNVTCITKSGNIQFQVRDDLGAWFTPNEASFTIIESSLVRIPRANMPDMRILATADATFAVAGDL